MRQLKIIVKVLPNGPGNIYEAYLDGRPEIRGTGLTQDEAVGDFILRNQLQLELDITIERHSA